MSAIKSRKTRLNRPRNVCDEHFAKKDKTKSIVDGVTGEKLGQAHEESWEV